MNTQREETRLGNEDNYRIRDIRWRLATDAMHLPPCPPNLQNTAHAILVGMHQKNQSDIKYLLSELERVENEKHDLRDAFKSYMKLVLEEEGVTFVGRVGGSEYGDRNLEISESIEKEICDE